MSDILDDPSYRSHRPHNLDLDISSGWDLDMDMEDEQNVEESLPSTPLDESSGPAHSRAWKYATSNDRDLPHHGPSSSAGEEGETPQTRSDEEEAKPLPRNQEQERKREEDTASDKTCRICFSGPEEEAILGRMISPCLCTGSMRYVHVKCLNAWRGTGTNAKAHLECPQCHYRYQLRRTLISGLATSRPILLLSTLMTFTFLTLLLGETLHLLLHHSPTISRTLLSRSNRPTVKSMFDLMDDPYTAMDGGPVIVVGGGGALIWDIFIGSIQTFVDLSNSFLVYKDRVSTNLHLPSPLANLGFELVVRFLLGLATIGSMSFLSLLLSLSLFGPLQLMNGLRGFGFLGNFARRRGGGGGNTDNAGRISIGTIMMVILVLVGAVNTLIQFYNGLTSVTHKLLVYVETQILEVNSDEIRQARKDAREKERKKREAEKWWIRWIKDGQYKRVEGYKELAVRFSLGLDRRVERVKGWFRQDGHEQVHEE